MNTRELIDLRNLTVIAPKVLKVEGELINLEGLFFMENIVERIVVEKDAGLIRINVYDDRQKIASHPFLNKNECSIERVMEDDKKIIIIKVR